LIFILKFTYALFFYYYFLFHKIYIIIIIFIESEEGALSFFEVVASCRDSNEAPFPKESSKEFREGMKLFKKIKDSLYDTG